MEEHVGQGSFTRMKPDYTFQVYCKTNRHNGYYYYSPVTGEFRGWYRDSGDALYWYLRELNCNIKINYVDEDDGIPVLALRS